MYGEGMGELNVYIKPVTGNLKNVWSLSGDQGDEWKMAQVTLDSDSSEYQVTFETLESFDQSPKGREERLPYEIVGNARCLALSVHDETPLFLAASISVGSSRERAYIYCGY